MTEAFEVNFDGLVGPTHNYSGLSFGNVASTSHRALESSPLAAVLQGLEKMKTLADAGFKQGVLPPQERPDVSILRKLGFTGSDKKIIEEAFKRAPDILSAASSASSMWTANAATVSPSADSSDRRVHFTPANLVSKFHRSIEPATTARALKKIFKNPKHFVHHEPLPSVPAFGDEGAANHTRLCAEYGERGIQFFVYGKYGVREDAGSPKKFPARQTKEASEAVARHHLLSENAVVFAQQNPEAIDTGVFHNDVAGVGNRNVYFFHEKAYAEGRQAVDKLALTFNKVCKRDLIAIEVPANQVSLEDAVKSYLFNSQLLSLPNGKMFLVAPSECQESPSVSNYISQLLQDTSQPIQAVKFFNLRESMRNGGGPACLRLRVVLTTKELAATNAKVFMSDTLFAKLTKWAKKHYRDRLVPNDLRDPNLLKECRSALDELTSILGLGSIYPFQL